MRELRVRVTVAGALTTAVLAAAAFGVAGPAAGLGMLAAGGITLANFWWLVHNATAASGSGPAARRFAWVLTAGLRFVVVGAALIILLASGAVHPLAFVVGLGIVPGVLIVLGLQAARSEAC